MFGLRITSQEVKVESLYSKTKDQVPSTDGPKAEVPDSNPDSRRTPDDFDKNVPKDAAAPRNDFDAAVSKDVSDTVSKRTPDDSNGGSGHLPSDDSAFLKKKCS